ncbi:MAG: carbon monoxide dehydrogenase [Pseudonocardiales bacterium]|nr:SRPBCC family protein [Actinomycetota bacterium]PZS17191.1 MAG: carbon monoxide dehydrogenase [Pseudonocardiales bacterium]
MKLEHRFTVPAPIDTVWRALLDPERVAPCFPGASITSASGDEFAGIVKVRLGPISLQYRGSGRFTDTDQAAHRTVIQATGTASGGQGTVRATVQASLVENGEGTEVTVATDMIVTGRPAQFGRGLIEDVGGKIISQFADCLSRSLGSQEEPAQVAESAPSSSPPPASPQPVPSQPVIAQLTSPQPASSQPAQLPPARGQPARGQPGPVWSGPPPMADEIDLLEAAGGAVAKRALPAITGLVVLVLIIRWLVRRRPRGSTPAARAGSPSNGEPARSVDLGDGGAE